MRDLQRSEVQRLIAEGTQLVEVLPRAEFEEEHLPGAISMPLRDIEKAGERLDRARPVIVYCWDAA